jgi:hypothetical protein
MDPSRWRDSQEEGQISEPDNTVKTTYVTQWVDYLNQIVWSFQQQMQG